MVYQRCPKWILENEDPLNAPEIYYVCLTESVNPRGVFTFETGKNSGRRMIKKLLSSENPKIFD